MSFASYRQTFRHSFRTVCICVFCCLLPHLAVAGGTAPPAYSVAMRSFGVWEPGTGERVDLSVWYPSRVPSQEKVQEGWFIEAGRRGRIVPGFYPIVLISHDLASSRFANNDLAIALAGAGMIVVVPTHTGDSQNNTSQIHSAALLRDRPRHLLRALETLLASPDFAPYADESRIGLLGVGTGSVTVMQLAGAVPDFSLVPAYCGSADEEDGFCAPWTTKHLMRLPETMRRMQAEQGEDVFSPPLDLFAPELVSVPVPASAMPLLESSTQPKGEKKPGFLGRFFGTGDDEEEAPEQAPEQAQEKKAEPTDSGGSGAFPIALDFQGGELFGGTNSASPFVHIALPDSPQFRVAVANDGTESAPASPEPAPSKADASRAFRRLPELRQIRAIALMTPAGGMLFSRQNLADIQVPVAMIEAGRDTLYPPQGHAQPFFAQLPSPPLVMTFDEIDHFSLFAQCSRETLSNLGDACGRMQGDARNDLAVARDNFIVPFFQSVLGEPLAPPAPSGFVAVETGQ